MIEAKAFAPCHITGIFQIFDKSADPLFAGSRGAGVSLSKGVETIVKAEIACEASERVIINGDIPNSADVSKRVISIFLSRFKEMENCRITVEHDIAVPIGAGFGTSGASALSLALALNKFFGLGMSRIEAAQLAHVAEVECKTGLGTVIAETFGGAEVRVKPGAPGIGEIRNLQVPKNSAVACLVFGPLSTKKFLTDIETRKRINELGGRLVDKLIETPNLGDFMKLSRRFAEHVGLVTENVRSVFEATDDAGLVCSMPMFGESVFALTPKESLENLLEIFHEHGSSEKIIVTEVDHKGARLF